MSKDSFAVRAGWLLGMFLGVAAFFYREAFSKMYLNLGDGMWEYSLAAFFKSWISRGIFPFWNPSSGFGVPEWMVICPFSLDRFFLLFLPIHVVWNLVKILNFVLSGWLLSAYLLRRTALFFPSFLGGLVVSVAQLNLEISFASYFLFILAFIFADRLIQARSYQAGTLLAFSLLAFYCNALPQPIISATLFLFCYILIRFRLHRAWDRRAWGLAIFPFFLVGLLFSLQMIRMKELLDLSLRFKVADREVFSVLPWEYFRMIWPQYDATSLNSALNFIPDRMLVALQNRFFKSAAVLFGQPPYYGILPFFAVVCLFFKKQLRSSERNLFLFVFVMLLAPILNPVLYPLIKHIPVIGLAGGQSLFSCVYSHVLLLLVAILTALSLGYLSEDPVTDQFRLMVIRRVFLTLAALVLLSTMIRLFVSAVFHFNGDWMRQFLSRALAPAFSSGQFHQSPGFYALRTAQAVEFLRLWASPRNAYFSVPVFLILGSMGILYARVTEKIGKRFFLFGCLALCLVDAYVFRPQTCFAPAELTPYPLEADFIKKDKGLYRVMALQDKSMQAADAAANDTRNVVFRPETHLLYGLSSPECLRSMVVANYGEYMSRMVPEGVRGRMVAEFGSIQDLELLDLANIKYIVAPISRGGADLPPDHFDRVYQTVRCNVFRNKLAKDRAFLLQGGNGAGSVTIDEYLPHSIRLNVMARTSNELVLTDLYYPGWIASIDGIQSPITKYEATFRKVSIPPGQHTVEFKYRPDYLVPGIVLQILGLLIASWAVIRGKRKPASAS